MREQLESQNSQISRLQQENGILRDAVSSATNQMESKLVLHSIDKTLQLMLHMSYLFSVVQGGGDVIHQILCHLLFFFLSPEKP